MNLFSCFIQSFRILSFSCFFSGFSPVFLEWTSTRSWVLGPRLAILLSFWWDFSICFLPGLVAVLDIMGAPAFPFRVRRVSSVGIWIDGSDDGISSSSSSPPLITFIIFHHFITHHPNHTWASRTQGRDIDGRTDGASITVHQSPPQRSQSSSLLLDFHIH